MKVMQIARASRRVINGGCELGISSSSGHLKMMTADGICCVVRELGEISASLAFVFLSQISA